MPLACNGVWHPCSEVCHGLRLRCVRKVHASWSKSFSPSSFYYAQFKDSLQLVSHPRVSFSSHTYSLTFVWCVFACAQRITVGTTKNFVPPVAHQVKGCLGHNSVAPPRTSLLATKAQPLLDALKRPTPALRAFTDALFDALDSQFEPRRTGYIERTKIIKESELIANYYPDFADTEVAESKWKTKALYKSGGFAYVKTLHGDALTEAGYAAIWAFQMSISPGKSYGMACILAVRLNLPAHAHVVRQQFPCDLSAEAEQAAWLQWATRYNKVLGSFWKYQATQVDYMPLVIGGAKLAVKQMGSLS
jgi:hypothetical protein